MAVDEAKLDLMAMTGDVVTAYAANHKLSIEELTALIESVHRALEAAAGGVVEAVEKAPATPAIPIRRSVTPDFVICLEDGRKFKSLKRHLRTAYGMSPEEYRAKWNLPKDYPMVAPNYAAARSAMAKSIGLGSNKAARRMGKKA